MRHVGVYDAKTQLPRLLEGVERGEIVTITRHGKPVARLVPVGARRRTVSEAIEELLVFREEHTLDGLSVRELIEEGRGPGTPRPFLRGVSPPFPRPSLSTQD